MKMAKDTTFLLLTDPEFVRWVRSPDAELDTYWKNWLLAHPDKIKSVKEAREIINGLKSKQGVLPKNNKYEVLQKILATETPGTGPSSEKNTSQRDPFFWLIMGQWTKVAAILVFVLVSIFLLSRMAIDPAPLEPADVPKVAMIAKTTQFGEKLNFKLPDGSTVWLNSGSELIFPERFDSLERRVILTGEGFFDVQQDSSSTFRVVSGNLVTEAVGTSFNIKYIDTDQLAVSLVSGKVRINHDSLERGLILQAGQQLSYLDSDRRFEVKPFSTAEITGWREGLLQFSNAGFEEVIRQLERWYGVSISVTGHPSNTWQLSGKYNNQNLDLVLDRMAYIENFEYYISGKNVNLKF
ncbi:FecR family protein [Cyclobacterium plantarum]|uniref:DUF4974 domain-containing protein n=1 Tax=Cyclobacterium plantarum TaxID=2716263 RepID=A0ABX0HE57_9BACT|nr:FecR family protein [Cyclobacterium plantarum]NHE58265.1 DUF4974 domain-containing protein [Cyclobacterium plantarum]